MTTARQDFTFDLAASVPTVLRKFGRRKKLVKTNNKKKTSIPLPSSKAGHCAILYLKCRHLDNLTDLVSADFALERNEEGLHL